MRGVQYYVMKNAELAAFIRLAGWDEDSGFIACRIETYGCLGQAFVKCTASSDFDKLVVAAANSVNLDGDARDWQKARKVVRAIQGPDRLPWYVNLKEAGYSIGDPVAISDADDQRRAGACAGAE